MVILTGVTILLSQKLRQVEQQVDNYTEKYTVNTESGLKEGTYIKYDASGKIMEESVYLDDVLHGVRKLYDTTGQVVIEEHYNHGNFAGDYKTYYPNGRIEMEGIIRKEPCPAFGNVIIREVN